MSLLCSLTSPFHFEMARRIQVAGSLAERQGGQVASLRCRCASLSPPRSRARGTALFFLPQGFRHASLHHAQCLPVQSPSAKSSAGQLAYCLANAYWQTSVHCFQSIGHDNEHSGMWPATALPGDGPPGAVSYMCCTSGFRIRKKN